ncbi:DinB family protein [Acaricomes phytoseiuli]|uniref:DinB family protein n=1 Tax=Acaricomes phytoseiuli TaxID=291968 RepID=UPI0022215CAD|nr:DinB family protein [Acaricomes phytoseiuli]MCW1249468.1 DinB family protein [Acaricomes phytoseiuli]
MKNTLGQQLAEQTGWIWENQHKHKLETLTDEEYFREPAAGSWSIRPAGKGLPDVPQRGSGEYRIDFRYPDPQPAPPTTIAWLLGHVAGDVLAVRSANHFAGPAYTRDDYPFAGSAAQAFDDLADAIRIWQDGVSGCSDKQLWEPCGPAEGPYFGQFPLLTLVLHINREVIHHLAEVSLLLDGYRRPS